ncbi:phosphocholine cytidylyltransferase family protein [bacterium D16-51]|nr:phosphocholine cytidylyltransferase family protein [bacterium D16-59]RKI57742.1 phosphocholine cytidylyltransferase family protein [bacterium D16-51]
MKALIMAAGKGTRISRYIEGKPKCTVDIGGMRLIEYTIQKLLAWNVDKIGVVLGYQAGVLEDILSEYPVEIYYNYFYEVTNSIASAWFAKDFIDDDMVMMNADVFAEESVINRLFTMEKETMLLSDSSRREMADYKFYYEDNQLIKFGKELEGEDISGEYVGIARVGRSFLPEFKERLQNLIEEGKYNMWWEDVLYSFVGERPIYVEDVAGQFWAEVDFIEDYERILEFREVKGM